MLVEMVEPLELRDKEMLEETLHLVVHGEEAVAVVKEPSAVMEKPQEMEEQARILTLLGQPQPVQVLIVVTTLVVEAVECTILLLAILRVVMAEAVKVNLEMAEMELQELQTPEVVEVVEQVTLTLVMAEVEVQAL
tara:strand:+ start:187 stop:594 length:408 start_codon:yes stop_codon:yes gene_type:complete